MFLETIQHPLNVLITLGSGSFQLLLDGASDFLGLLLQTQASLFDTLQLQKKSNQISLVLQVITRFEYFNTNEKKISISL